MKKSLLLVLLMLIGLILSYYYEPSVNSLASGTSKKADATSLNFYLRDVETRTFNTEGIHTNTLITNNATQLTGEKEIILSHPQMQIALHETPWTANADIGRTNDSMKKIILNGNVMLSRTDGIADVSTETLVLDSKDEVAYTQSAVQIQARGSKTVADSIHIDLNREIIHLKNHVKTYYAPKNPHSNHTNE